MGKKKKNRVRSLPPRNPSRAKIATQIVLVYLGIVTITIFLSIHYIIPVYVNAQPSLWLYVVWAVFYVLPVLLAVIFGATFRPFWMNSRNVLVSILAIEIFISFCVSVVRYEYLRLRDQTIQLSRIATFKVVGFTKESFDDNDDSLIDRMIFHGKFDMGDFPPGSYRLIATLVKTHNTDLKFIIGSFVVPWEIRKGNFFKGHFELNFENSPREFKDGVFHLDLDLERLLPVDSSGKRILAVNRWIPFFRTTQWDGEDANLQDQTLPLAHIPQVASFTILPLAI